MVTMKEPSKCVTSVFVNNEATHRKAKYCNEKAVLVGRCVAIILWILATTLEYCSVAQLFGIARCTVCIIVRETCKAIKLGIL